MARITQLDPVTTLVLDPNDQFMVEHEGDFAHRASQQQVIRGLLSQTNDGAIAFPPGSYGQLLLAGAAGEITAFGSTPGPLVELGSTVSNPVLDWVVSPTNITSQTLAGPLTGGVALTPSDRVKTLSGNVVADAIWTLTVNTTLGTLTRQAALSFGHLVHFGRSAAAALNAAAILALAGSRLALDALGDYAYAAGSAPNLYLWFCFPDSWGAYTLLDIATGLPIAVTDMGTVSVTNASGHTRNFRCLRSLNALNSAVNVRVV